VETTHITPEPDEAERRAALLPAREDEPEP
jgi:hypothetical protein